MRRTLAAGLAGLALAGCGSNTSTDAEATANRSQTPSTTQVEPDTEYGSVVALRDAAVVAGLPCPAWRQKDLVENAAESADCSRSSVLATYATNRDLQKALDNLRGMQELFEDQDIPSHPILVGPNWTINSPDSADLQPVLGGTVLR